MMSNLEKILTAAGDDIAGWVIFLIFAGTGASALGLSMYLRGGGALTMRKLFGVMLHSLMWGVMVFLVGFSTLKHDMQMLLGFSILSGIGTASLLDVVLMFIKMKFGISVTINPPPRP